MTKLQKYVKRLQEAGLSERQIDEVVHALNEYLNAKFIEDDAQQGKENS